MPIDFTQLCARTYPGRAWVPPGSPRLPGAWYPSGVMRRLEGAGSQIQPATGSNLGSYITDQFSEAALGFLNSVLSNLLIARSLVPGEKEGTFIGQSKGKQAQESKYIAGVCRVPDSTAMGSLLVLQSHLGHVMPICHKRKVLTGIQILPS